MALQVVRSAAVAAETLGPAAEGPAVLESSAGAADREWERPELNQAGRERKIPTWTD